MMTYRRWTARVLGITAFVLVAVSLLNYVVDPYGRYGTGAVPPLEIQPRSDKYKLMVAQPDNAQILLLGSSRMFLMRPRLVKELTGLRTFNATISRAMPRDYLILGRFAIHTMHPQRIIAGVDLQVFHPTILWDNGVWLRKSPLRVYAGDNSPAPSAEEEFSTLLNLQQTFDSIRSVWQALTVPPLPFSYDADGGLKPGVHPENDSSLRGNGSVGDPDFWASYTALAPDRLDEVRAFFKLCQEAHVELDIVLLPFDGRALQRLQTIPNFVARLEEYRKFLQESEELYGIKVYDYTDPASLGGDPTDFQDYFHPLQSTMDRITQAIFAPTIRSDVI